MFEFITLISSNISFVTKIDPITASELASQFGVKIYTIGAGTDQAYTKIPGRGLILNEIDETTLKKIAEVQDSFQSFSYLS